MLHNPRLLVPLLSVALLQLLPHAVTAKNKLWTKNGFQFGKPIIVNFDLSPEPTEDTWIAIWHEDEDGSVDGGSTLLRANLCGHQKDNKCTDPPASGTIKFTHTPNVSYDANAPLGPGNYKACLVVGQERPYTELKCRPFEVKKGTLTDERIEESSVTADASSFLYGHAITASFVSKPRTISSWIGLYRNEWTPFLESGTVPHNMAWVYSGCNNQDGNTFSKACTTRLESGAISLDATTQDDVDWYPVPGIYKLCLHWMVNRPYDYFVCSDSFVYGDISSSPSLTVSDTITYGSQIVATFINPQANDQNWFAIIDTEVGPDEEDEALWSSMCGGQDDWDNGCVAPLDGTVTFKDSSTASYQDWPLDPGSYKLCLAVDDYWPYYYSVCAAFDVV